MQATSFVYAHDVERDNHLIATLEKLEELHNINSKKKMFHSIGEIKLAYFPNNYEEELIKQLSPDGMGRYLAIKSLKEYKTKLENLTNIS